jgi:hypothetical protein
MVMTDRQPPETTALDWEVHEEFNRVVLDFLRA